MGTVEQSVPGVIDELDWFCSVIFRDVLREVVTCAYTSLGYEFGYAFDVGRKVVSEPSGDFGSGVVESKGKFKLLMWVGSHGVSMCRGSMVDRVGRSLVLC